MIKLTLDKIMSTNSTGTSIRIREATLSDIEGVWEIYRQYVEGADDIVTFEETMPTVEEMCSRFTKVCDSKLPYLIATSEDNKVVGYCYASPYRPRSAYRYSVENSIYVHQEYHRCGIGHKLMTELMLRLGGVGIKQIVAVLGVKEDNPSSHGLHSRLGFCEAGVLKNIGFKHGRWIDRLFMQYSYPSK